MNTINSFKKILKRYGRPAFAYSERDILTGSGNCFIQALRYKNKMYVEGTPTELGINESGYYLFLADSSFDISGANGNGYISDDSKKYHIDRFENVFIGDNVFVVWAVIKEIIEGDYPIYNHFTKLKGEL